MVEQTPRDGRGYGGPRDAEAADGAEMVEVPGRQLAEEVYGMGGDAEEERGAGLEDAVEEARLL